MLRDVVVCARLGDEMRGDPAARLSAQEPGAVVRIPRLAGGQTIQASTWGPGAAKPKSVDGQGR